MDNNFDENRDMNIEEENEDTLDSIDESEDKSIENTDLDESEDESEDESTESTKDSVPLKTFLQTKEENKVLRKQIADIEDKQYEETIKAKRQETYNNWIAKGFTPDVAQAMADEVAGVYKEMSEMRIKKTETYIDAEIEELSTEDFYSDIKEYSTRIKDRITRGKKVGFDISVKEAYLNIVGIDTKMKESKIKAEAKKRIQGSPNKGDGIKTSSSSKNKSKSGLLLEEQKTLSQLQQMQPNNNWDEKKYIKLMRNNE